MTEATSKSSPSQHVYSLLKQFDVAMVLSGVGEHQTGRPMSILQIDEHGDIWFIASMDAERTRVIEADPRVTLICQSKMIFLNVMGVARLDRSAAKLDELWSDAFKAWFPEGKGSPDLTLIAVTPISAEYWDQTGVKGLKYLLEAAKARLRGETVHADPNQHQRTALVEAPTASNQKH